MFKNKENSNASISQDHKEENTMLPPKNPWLVLSRNTSRKFRFD